MPPLAVSMVLFSTLLHASWNLLAKQGSGTPDLFPRVLLALVVPGVLIGLLGEWRATAVLPVVGPFLLVTGAFQAAYFLGLTMGYRAGDLSLVYPLVRALPVLLISVFDVLRGKVPGTAGWLGLALVLIGCLLVAVPAPTPGTSPAGGAGDATDRLRDTGGVRLPAGGGSARHPVSGHGPPATRTRRWHGAAIGWAVVAALGTVGYTVADKLAADALSAAGRAGAGAAFRYGSLEFAISAAYFLPLLALVDRTRKPRPVSRSTTSAPPPTPPTPPVRQPRRWPVVVLIAALVYVTYALVLWAFQLSWQTSYVVALRQFSIVVGAVGGTLLLGEAARALRITGAVVIVAGVAAITLAG
ncbi:MAG: hypothetical protein OXP69_20750 [Spirochaetaceae bacterium]|nr:hypothetical protein [Spirochaetaceae bacterium]